MLKSRSSQLKLSWAIALRYLQVTSRTVTGVGRLALLGLAISVAVLVVVISIVNGFERELRERVMALLPSIKVHHQQVSMPETVECANAAGIIGVARVVEGSVLLTANKKLKGAQLTGVDPAEYGAVSAIAEFTQSGDLSILNQHRFSILLGSGLAEDLGVEVGETLRLILPSGPTTAAGPVPRQREMFIADVIDSSSQLDSLAVFTTRETARKLFRGAQAVKTHVRLDDLFVAGPALELLRSTYGEEVRIDTWMDSYGNLYQAIAVQKLTMLVLLSFLVAVAAFNLVSGLIMIVERRREDVAIMSTFGLQSGNIMHLFLILGGALAAGGICLGLMLGVSLAWLIPAVFTTLSNELGIELMSQYFIAYLPVDVRALDLLTIAGTSMLLAMMAIVVPARRATKFQPSQILAHE